MIKDIEKIFKNRKSKFSGEFKESAVLILITEENEQPYIVFEVRSLNLRHQPGDICLPGGKVEIGETPKDAAIREAIEELNLDKEDIEFIGSLDYVVTPYNFIIYPFVAKLKSKNIIPNSDEVDHVFKVPLEFFMKEEPFFHYVSVLQKPEDGFPFNLIRNGENYKFRTGKIPEYFYVFNDYVIWGFTALIIKQFIDIIKK